MTLESKAVLKSSLFVKTQLQVGAHSFSLIPIRSAAAGPILSGV